MAQPSNAHTARWQMADGASTMDWRWTGTGLKACPVPRDPPAWAPKDYGEGGLIRAPANQEVHSATAGADISELGVPAAATAMPTGHVQRSVGRNWP